MRWRALPPRLPGLLSILAWALSLTAAASPHSFGSASLDLGDVDEGFGGGGWDSLDQHIFEVTLRTRAASAAAAAAADDPDATAAIGGTEAGEQQQRRRQGEGADPSAALGLELDGRGHVTAVLMGTPAEDSGMLQVGDAIISVNGGSSSAAVAVADLTSGCGQSPSGCRLRVRPGDGRRRTQRAGHDYVVSFPSRPLGIELGPAPAAPGRGRGAVVRGFLRADDGELLPAEASRVIARGDRIVAIDLLRAADLPLARIGEALAAAPLPMQVRFRPEVRVGARQPDYALTFPRTAPVGLQLSAAAVVLGFASRSPAELSGEIKVGDELVLVDGKAPTKAAVRRLETAAPTQVVRCHGIAKTAGDDGDGDGPDVPPTARHCGMEKAPPPTTEHQLLFRPAAARRHSRPAKRATGATGLVAAADDGGGGSSSSSSSGGSADGDGYGLHDDVWGADLTADSDTNAFAAGGGGGGGGGVSVPPSRREWDSLLVYDLGHRPASVVLNLTSAPALFGPAPPCDPRLIPLRLMDPLDGCMVRPGQLNTAEADLQGMAAVVERGGCQFAAKVANAAASGAAAILVVNGPGQPIERMRPPPGGMVSASIPALMVDHARGVKLMRRLRRLSRSAAAAADAGGPLLDPLAVALLASAPHCSSAATIDAYHDDSPAGASRNQRLTGSSSGRSRSLAAATARSLARSRGGDHDRFIGRSHAMPSDLGDRRQGDLGLRTYGFAVQRSRGGRLRVVSNRHAITNSSSSSPSPSFPADADVDFVAACTCLWPRQYRRRTIQQRRIVAGMKCEDGTVCDPAPVPPFIRVMSAEPANGCLPLQVPSSAQTSPSPGLETDGGNGGAIERGPFDDAFLLMKRGSCSLHLKVATAQAAGARGIILVEPTGCIDAARFYHVPEEASQGEAEEPPQARRTAFDLYAGRSAATLARPVARDPAPPILHVTREAGERLKRALQLQRRSRTGRGGAQAAVAVAVNTSAVLEHVADAWHQLAGFTRAESWPSGTEARKEMYRHLALNNDPREEPAGERNSCLQRLWQSAQVRLSKADHEAF